MVLPAVLVKVAARTRNRCIANRNVVISQNYCRENITINCVYFRAFLLITNVTDYLLYNLYN